MIQKKRQLDLLVGALEGGSNYWYMLEDTSMVIKKGTAPKTPELIEECKTMGKDFADCLVNRIWETVQSGVSVPVFDVEEEGEKLGEISKESIEKANELMIKDYSQAYADVMNENDDANTADIWFQLAVMGEVIFG